MISIIIPVYNVSQYLDECLKSVSAQTYTDWECILIDDGSTDDSGEICERWCRADPRFKVVHQANAGVSAARNKGIDLAQGDYITFIDSDDWVDADYLSVLYNHCFNAELVVSGIIIHDAEDNIKKQQPKESRVTTISSESYLFDDLISQQLLHGPTSKLYKALIIKASNTIFPIGKSFGEDLEFNFSFLNYVTQLSCIRYSGYHYRKSVLNSLSSKFREDQFFNDFHQWSIQEHFYSSRGLLSTDCEKWLYRRLWGQTYDGIFLFSKLSCPRLSYIQNILALPNMKKMKEYKDVFECSKWIKCAITNRCSILFYLYFKFKRLLCK